MHQLMRALSRRDFEAAAACLAEEAGWDAPRLEAALAPVFADGGELRCDPPARQSHWTRIEPRDDLAFEVVQTLIDAEGEGDLQLEAEVVLEDTRLPPGPMLRLVGLRE
jgi:hypothetical protein